MRVFQDSDLTSAKVEPKQKQRTIIRVVFFGLLFFFFFFEGLYNALYHFSLLCQCMLFVYPAACSDAAGAPWDRMTQVVTCSCLALEQRGELKFVVCSLVEALSVLSAFQASSDLFLSSQGVCEETCIGRQGRREACRAIPGAQNWC